MIYIYTVESAQMEQANKYFKKTTYIQPLFNMAADDNAAGSSFETSSTFILFDCLENHLHPFNLSYDISSYVQKRLRLYENLRESINFEINYFEYSLLFDRATEQVTDLLRKKAHIEKIISYLDRLSYENDNCTKRLLQLAEFEVRGCNDFYVSKNFGLFNDSIWACISLEQYDRKVRFTHAKWLSGRMRRFSFIKYKRDIRRFYRNIIRIIFKNLDDQSGEPEHVVPNFLWYQHSLKLKKWSNGQKRNYIQNRGYY